MSKITRRTGHPIRCAELFLSLPLGTDRVTVFAVRTTETDNETGTRGPAGTQYGRSATICEPSDADEYIAQYIKACTGEERWYHPPSEVWVAEGWCFADRCCQWLEGVRVFPA